MKKNYSNKPIPVQAGIGLRQPHLNQVLLEKPDIGWLEVHAENFFSADGAHINTLEKIREDYPLSVHGVGLSLGTTDQLNLSHLQKLKTMIERFQPAQVSEHLSWGAVHGQYFNDLLPVPYTESSLRNFCDNVSRAQDFIGRQLLIENPSSYLEFRESEISEWEFYASLPKYTGCALLLDVNNFFVNSFNHGFHQHSYIEAVNPVDVKEIHLAGHAVKHFDEGTVLIDDHGSLVNDEVWSLYSETLDKLGPKPTLIEWDTDIPDISVLLSEAQHADQRLQAIAVEETA